MFPKFSFIRNSNLALQRHEQELPLIQGNFLWLKEMCPTRDEYNNTRKKFMQHLCRKI